MSVSVPREKLRLLVKLGVVALILLAGAVMLLKGVDLKALLERGLGLFRDAGPWVFFTAMALLPAVGVPITMFTITAGSAFAGELGMGAVIAAALAAITVNLALTYWLATKAFRPLLTRLLQRLGYKLPEVATSDMTDLIVILRVTPGPPFFAQSYLLGLARVPFGKYMLISCAITWSYSAAFILFGDALLHGRGKMVFLGMGALVGLTAFTHLIRRHYGRKKAKA